MNVAIATLPPVRSSVYTPFRRHRGIKTDVDHLAYVRGFGEVFTAVPHRPGSTTAG